MEYILWRGDLSFSKEPLNDIDILILSLLSYLHYRGILPGIESNSWIYLKDTSDRYLSGGQNDKVKPSNFNSTASTSFDSELLVLLKKTAASARFENIRLPKYEEYTDFVVGQQFAAITYALPTAKREKIIAFRGTDNSMIGWNKDFELTYMEQTPAQESASR